MGHEGGAWHKSLPLNTRKAILEMMRGGTELGMDPEFERLESRTRWVIPD